MGANPPPRTQRERVRGALTHVQQARPPFPQSHGRDEISLPRAPALVVYTHVYPPTHQRRANLFWCLDMIPGGQYNCKDLLKGENYVTGVDVITEKVLHPYSQIPCIAIVHEDINIAL